MTRQEAKDLFRNDKDAYGKPKGIMKKIDRIYNEFELKMLEEVTTRMNAIIKRTWIEVNQLPTSDEALKRILKDGYKD